MRKKRYAKCIFLNNYDTKKFFIILLIVYVLVFTSSAGADILPSKKSYTRYQFGIWTGKLKLSEGADGLSASIFTRNPHSWKESVQSSGASYMDRGGFLVEEEAGIKILWESPTRVVIIDKTGMRQILDSDFPILIFEPKYLPVNVGVLNDYFNSHKIPDVLKISSLVGNELLELAFEKGKSVEGTATGKKVSAWIWTGTKPFSTGLYAERRDLVPFDLILTDHMTLLGYALPISDDVWIEDGYESLTTLTFWNTPQLSKPLFRVVPLESKTMIRMSDGISLAATIYLPGDPEKGEPTRMKGRFPTILMRTPYGRMNYLRDAFKFVSRGYAVIAQDTRGRGDSEGEFIPLVDEKSDGDETVTWIAEQPWSDGSVGMIGGSYVGLVQWHAAYKGNPHLKTLVSQVTSGPGLNDCPFINGCFVPGILTWSVRMNATPAEIKTAMQKNLNDVVAQLPLIDADIRAVGHEIPFWREWLSHTTQDEYWQKGDISRFIDKIDLPVLYLTGWFDDVLRGTIFYWNLMNRNKRNHQHLVLGPWRHGMNSSREIAKLEFGPDAIMENIHYIYVRWYDRWLKGIENGIDKEPSVRYFTLGENAWKTADTWPPPNVKPEIWYFHSAGKAQSPKDGATLNTRKPGSAAPDLYVYDPQNPTPFLVDIRTNELSPPEDYQEVEKREDTLVYTSEPFKDDFVISGSVSAVIHAATDSRDTDWVVRLTDVHPDGQSIRLVDGFMKARFRKSLTKEHLLTPDKVYEYHIPMTWMSHNFKQGHMLRVSIASAAAGLLAVNTNTGNPYAADTEYKIAHQTIYHDKNRPSHVILPVMHE
ncbi:MAG: CocE/NonD family hydrolase [Candidatus Aminicenantes bacterium]|nr:CocE/NonD family hydrolase [Candidatus Aminicenantes bacterium]